MFAVAFGAMLVGQRRLAAPTLVVNGDFETTSQVGRRGEWHH